MEEKLDLLILQNWAIIGLIGVLVCLSIFCGVVNLSTRRKIYSYDEDDPPDFRELWAADEMELLLAESERVLDKYPNTSDAIYYRARVLQRQNKNAEARRLLVRLAEIEPQLAETAEREIAVIDKTETND